MAHKNNEQNLIPASMRTPEERRRIAQKAGVASGEARRRKRNTKQTAKYILEMQPNLPKKVLDALINMGLDPDDDRPDIRLISIMAIAQKAMKGDLKANKMLLELSGDVDARTQLERERLKLEKERLAFERERSIGAAPEVHVDDGFMEALKGMAAEVNDSGADEPEDIDPEE